MLDFRVPYQFVCKRIAHLTILERQRGISLPFNLKIVAKLQLQFLLPFLFSAKLSIHIWQVGSVQYLETEGMVLNPVVLLF